ncbi:MAG TPA: ATP-grasp domain-containing protein [Pedococcus sp.]|nr:ATP-grasp domain-containing protein [Pedococcus sp.]
MNIIFVEPGFPANQRRFALALASVGANVIGIGESEEWALDDELRSALTGYYRVGSVTSVREMTDAVRFIQDRVWVDRLEATVEAHTMPAAQVRESTGIPGTSVHTTWLCRDKPSMKQALREAGVPTAASRAADHADEVWEFAATVGYPLILKPRAGAGAQDTMRVDSDAALAHALTVFGATGATSIAVEEFVEGHEGFYDTIAHQGRVVHDWTTHYYPNVLEAMRTRWISPQFVTTNRMTDSSFYGEVQDLGQRVIEALGISTSATHMEWFHGPKGLKFSEIGARPPGVGCWDLYSASNDVDVYREWAHVITHGMPEQPMRRPYSAGIVALRPDHDGQIRGYSGIDDIQARYGQWVIDGHFPPEGHHTQPVEAGYMANAYVRLRHPDYDTLRGMLDDVGRTIHVYAG